MIIQEEQNSIFSANIGVDEQSSQHSPEIMKNKKSNFWMSRN
jgi:hypothetical protein